MTKSKQNAQVEIIKASMKSLSKFDSENTLNPSEKESINNKLKAEMIELQKLKDLNPEDFL